MYVIIKRNKAEELKEKLHMIKRCVCQVMEELEEAKPYHDDNYYDMAREGGHDFSRREKDMESYYDMARGRSGSGRYR